MAKKKPASADLPAVDDNMKEKLEILVGTVAEVRHIAKAVRPGLPDDIGLFAAIEWQIEVFSKRPLLPFTLKNPMKPYSCPRLML